MRFGETAANKFDEATLKVKSFTSSSEECRSNVTDAELLEKVNAALTDENKANGVTAELDSTSIEAARKDLDVVDETYSSPFYQFADIETKTLDVFNNFGSITFDYANGFAYRHFPAFEKAINNPSINISYDSIFTPKEVERAIQEIENRKSDLNDVLFLEDKGVPEVYTPTDPGEVGIITGAHCGNYLTAKLSEIKVRLTDCNGRYLDTVPFDDYIIGVANGEVSHRSDDYVLSEMLAALSYALKRHNNYTKGDIITMRSGTCDQVYCNPKKGCTNINDVVPGCSACHSYTIGGSRGYYPSIYPIYQALYEKASQYLVVSNGTPHNCHYVSTVQNRWNEKANRGMPFTQIIAEEYASEGAQVVKCSDLEGPENEELPEEPETKIGHEATADYPEVSPDKGPFYGFAYKNESNGVNITIIPEWKTANLTTIKPKCSVSEFANMSFTVHAKAVKNYEKAFEGICTLLTTGVTLSDGSTCKFTMDDLKDGTAFIERKNAGGSFDLHPYGLSQDWNYSKTYTISGKTYKPYNTRELSDYLDFVNAIGGKEENCQNVNYILYLKAYKDAGFKWGGNYGRNGNSGSFDGKLFELVYTEG